MLKRRKLLDTRINDLRAALGEMQAGRSSLCASNSCTPCQLLWLLGIPVSLSLCQPYCDHFTSILIREMLYFSLCLLRVLASHSCRHCLISLFVYVTTFLLVTLPLACDRYLLLTMIVKFLSLVEAVVIANVLYYMCTYRCD